MFTFYAVNNSKNYSGSMGSIFNGRTILLLTLRNASRAPFSMNSITIMTGFPKIKKMYIYV